MNQMAHTMAKSPINKCDFSKRLPQQYQKMRGVEDGNKSHAMYWSFLANAKLSRYVESKMNGC